MSREIKFRAWSEYSNKMVDWESMISDETFMNVLNGDDEKIHVMQFTGLKDKKSRDIYEGDIYQWDVGIVGVIKHKDGSFYLETTLKLPGDKTYEGGLYSPWLRVIKDELERELEYLGNIYESSDLINK